MNHGWIKEIFSSKLFGHMSPSSQNIENKGSNNRSLYDQFKNSGTSGRNLYQAADTLWIDKNQFINDFGLLWQAIIAMEESPDVITSVFFPITFLIKSVTSST